MPNVINLFRACLVRGKGMELETWGSKFYSLLFAEGLKGWNLKVSNSPQTPWNLNPSLMRGSNLIPGGIYI